MATIRYDQSNFAYGEIDPKAAARTDIEPYYRAAKKLRNCIVIPQGGVKNRFGTNYVSSLTIATLPQYCRLKAVEVNDAIYLLAFQANAISIFLENQFLLVIQSNYQQEDIINLNFSQVNDRLIITNQNFPQQQLVRSANAAINIANIDAVNNYFLVNNLGLNVGCVYPLIFNTNGNMPTTNPQIYAGRTYYLRAISNTAFKVYSSSQDAINNVNAYVISNAGANSYFQVLNSWTLSNIVFKNIPSHDFLANYANNNVTFQPSAIKGNINIVCNTAGIFTPNHVGGVFSGNSGSARITAYSSNTTVAARVVTDFKDANAIPGSESFLGEPAWSTTRGYPKVSTYYQGRVFFASTNLIPNGVWGSVVNSVYDFDDSETLDDNAISWYPSGGNSNDIQSMTSGRSLILHSDTGNYTSPAFLETPITPTNFCLVEQNKDGISKINPVFIDNQILYVDSSLTNVKVLCWDISQSSYVLNNISIFSSSLIVSPVDMESFTNPQYSEGCFVFVVNGDGTLAILQTLSEENIRAWTLSNTQTMDVNGNVTPSKFCQSTSCGTRCWFLVQRTVNGQQALMIEELDFTKYTDCSYVNPNLNSNIVTGLGYLEGCQVNIIADGFVLANQTVVGGQINLPQVAASVVIGLPFVSTLMPLPIGNIQGTPSNLYLPKKIRCFYVNYFQSQGITIQGRLIAMPMRNVRLDQPNVPMTGIFEYNMMEGWDSNSFDITIEQPNPLPMTIRGISYILEM